MLNFDINQLNSPFDDSVFYVRNVYKKRAFLFDCGRLGNIDHSEILSLSEIFVSHAHMDHFFGFDRVLRGSLVSNHELTVFGPPGFIDNVDGKFRGYVWNLVDEGYYFVVKVVELHPSGNHKMAYFRAKDRFIPEVHNYVIKNNIIELGEGFTAQYEFFDHRTPSLGYKISEPVQFAINKELLLKSGYKPGPWLSELKKALTESRLDVEINSVRDGEIYTRTVKEFADELVTVKKPQVLTYITDISPTESNIEKAVAFAKDSSLLIIEAVFLEEDKEHAVKKNHLTLDISKDIFNRSGSELVRFTHFASRYEFDKVSFLQKVYEGMDGKIYSLNRGKL